MELVMDKEGVIFMLIGLDIYWISPTLGISTYDTKKK